MMRPKWTLTLATGVFVGAMALCGAGLLLPPLRAEGAALQPSPRPTIDLTATQAALLSSTPATPTPASGATNTGAPPVNTTQPQITATATAIRARPSRTPTAAPPTETATPPSAPPSETPTAAPPTEIPATQTPWIIYITTTPDAGGGVIVITVIPTLAPTPTPAPQNTTDWSWLAWLVLALLAIMLGLPLLWLLRRRLRSPMVYPVRGRVRRATVRPARIRRKNTPF